MQPMTEPTRDELITALRRNLDLCQQISSVYMEAYTSQVAAAFAEIDDLRAQRDAPAVCDQCTDYEMQIADLKRQLADGGEP